MVAGIYVAVAGDIRRPRSKKEVKEVMARDPYSVIVEDTGMFGGGFSGGLGNMETGDKVVFVGPDPYTARNFYGTIARTAKGFKLT